MLLGEYMRTKIIATVGPASSERNVLTRLVESGVRIFRLNFSHGSAGDFEEALSFASERSMGEVFM